MVAPRPSKTHIGNHALKPETLMLSYGYDPKLSEGAVKPPVFLTSTFVFGSAEEGRDFFDYAAGRRKPPAGTGAGLVYSRFNHPNSEIVEDRLAVYEGAEACVLFSSGMSAISTTILAFARPGDVILHSQPLYGGTETLLSRTMAGFGIASVGFVDGVDEAAVRAAAERGTRQGTRLGHHDRDAGQPDQHAGRYHAVAADRRRDRRRPGLPADPGLRQHPAGAGVPASARPRRRRLGLLADQVCRRPFRSHRRRDAGRAGDHRADQGACAAASARSSIRIPAGCWAARWKRSAIRMERAEANARLVAEYLRDHPKVDKVHYLKFLEEGSQAQAVFARQCTGAGSTFSFDIKGGEKEAFAFLNALQIFKLAVSLGGTESLASHPAAMTHSGVPVEVRDRIGVLDTTIRLSVGIEHPDDLIADLTQALAATG